MGQVFLGATWFVTGTLAAVGAICTSVRGGMGVTRQNVLALLPCLKSVLFSGVHWLQQWIPH